MRRTRPLTPAQLAELDFVPPAGDGVCGRAALTAANLKNCVVYIREAGGKSYWFYAVGSPRGGVLCGYRRVGRAWRPGCVREARIKEYY